MNWPAWALLGYGGLLLASYVARATASKCTLGDRHSVSLRVVRRGLLGKRPVRLAYYDSDPTADTPVLLLVHGSPGTGQVVRKLAALLEGPVRIIAPDLPGFGASTHDLPDYSFQAHAVYLWQLIDQLGIRRVHLAGFSMGGGVVLSMARLAPGRVCSLTMISALGVQEHELTGNYWVNRALHGMQLATLLVLTYAFPHFGRLDGDHLSVRYARNFLDSDQRPLRAMLQSYRGPLLIVHGHRDRNVPVCAAKEHHRLVPQSRLVLIPSDHFAAFRRPELIAPALREFLEETMHASGG